MEAFDEKDLYVLTILSTAAAHYEDLRECLVSFSPAAKKDQLYMACLGLGVSISITEHQ